jgi:hypothetical protein
MENIFFVSMMRSGHHAVLNWYARNQFQPIRHFNDCRIVCGDIIPDPPNLIVFYNGHANQYLLNEPPHAQEEWIENCAKTIFSFEERDQGYIEAAADIVRPQRIIYVVRDPLNFIASCLKHAEKYPQVKHKLIDKMAERLSIWKIHALKLEKKQTKSHCAINFNLWFQHRSYRDNIAIIHGFVNQDVGVDEVMLFGKGSSFDGLQYATNATMMNVLNRWETYQRDPDFRSYITQELVEISERMFGVTYL